MNFIYFFLQVGSSLLSSCSSASKSLYLWCFKVVSQKNLNYRAFSQSNYPAAPLTGHPEWSGPVLCTCSPSDVAELIKSGAAHSCLECGSGKVPVKWHWVGIETRKLPEGGHSESRLNCRTRFKDSASDPDWPSDCHDAEWGAERKEWSVGFLCINLHVSNPWDAQKKTFGFGFVVGSGSDK